MKKSLLIEKRYFVIFMTVFLFVIIFLMCINRVNLKIMQSNNICSEFSTVRWNEEPANRIYMYESLMQNYDFYGMSKDDILKLLGNNYCSISKYGNLTYYMGEKADDWFSYNLYIYFDANNMVKGFELYQD